MRESDGYFLTQLSSRGNPTLITRARVYEGEDKLSPREPSWRSVKVKDHFSNVRPETNFHRAGQFSSQRLPSHVRARVRERKLIVITRLRAIFHRESKDEWEYYFRMGTTVSEVVGLLLSRGKGQIFLFVAKLGESKCNVFKEEWEWLLDSISKVKVSEDEDQPLWIWIPFKAFRQLWLTRDWSHHWLRNFDQICQTNIRYIIVQYQRQGDLQNLEEGLAPGAK